MTKLCHFNQYNRHFSAFRALSSPIVWWWLWEETFCWWWDEDADLERLVKFAIVLLMCSCGSLFLIHLRRDSPASVHISRECAAIHSSQWTRNNSLAEGSAWRSGSFSNQWLNCRLYSWLGWNDNRDNITLSVFCVVLHFVVLYWHSILAWVEPSVLKKKVWW